MDELILLSLQETYCLSILTYAIPTMNFSSKQMAELNACWNSIYRKKFSFNRWESVTALIHGLERLDFDHIMSLRKARSYRRLVFHQSIDCSRICFSDYFCKDSDLMYTFRSYTATMDVVYSDFHAIVT